MGGPTPSLCIRARQTHAYAAELGDTISSYCHSDTLSHQGVYTVHKSKAFQTWPYIRITQGACSKYTFPALPPNPLHQLSRAGLGILLLESFLGVILMHGVMWEHRAGLTPFCADFPWRLERSMSAS